MLQDELTARVACSLERVGVNYFVTGSFASMIYGEPRTTNDIDIVVLVKLGEVHPLLAEFPQPEFYLDEHALREAMAQETQANIIHVPTGLKIDLMHPPRTPYNTERFRRARARPLLGHKVRFAAPEDVILMKLVYYLEGASEKHLRDIATMLRVSHESIDRNYIEHWAPTLGVSEAWKTVADKTDAVRRGDIPPTRS